MLEAQLVWQSGLPIENNVRFLKSGDEIPRVVEGAPLLVFQSARQLKLK